MTQLDDLQAYTNLELPRRSAFITSTIAGYDGDPNDGGAPAILIGAPLGTWYHRAGTDDVYRKMGSGQWELSGGDGQTARITTSTMTIDVDLSTGVDPPTPIVVQNQADVDAWGAFATIEGVIESLPDTIAHYVTIQLSDGTHDPGYPNWVRLLWGGRTTAETGFITIKSKNGLKIAAGTVAMAVSSSSGAPGAHSVTLQADPGLGADAFKDYMLVVTAGTGLGKIQPIRSHSGTTFNIAGEYLPALDNTSVVEIRSAAAEVQFQDVFPYINFQRQTYQFGLELNAVDVVNVNATAGIEWEGVAVYTTGGARILNMIMKFNEAALITGTCLLRGLGVGYSHLEFNGGWFRTAFGTTYPVLMRANGAARAVTVNVVGRGAGVYCYGGQQFDDYGTCVFELGGALVLAEVFKTGGAVARIGGTAPTYAAIVKDGAKFATNVGELSFLASGFNGSTSDLQLDGQSGAGYDWSDVDADPDDIMIGVKGSRVYAQIGGVP